MSGHSSAPKSGKLSLLFSKFAQATAAWSGHPVAFLLALTIVLVWIVSGPVFHYSDTWQLVINTGTTIVTFLMVFLIQNTQNRDMLTIQLKLSELVLAMKGAENKFAAIEDLSDEELAHLHEQCRERAERALGHIEQRKQERMGGGKGDQDESDHESDHTKSNRSQSNYPKGAASRAKSAKRTSRAH